MEKHTHVYKVGMTCDGCKNAIEKVLNRQKDKGVENVSISLDTQTVKVTTTLPQEDIFQIIQKTGKPVEFVKTE